MARVNRKWGRFEAFCRRRNMDPAIAKARIETAAIMVFVFLSFVYLAAR